MPLVTAATFKKTGSLSLAVVVSLGLYLFFTSAFYPLGFLSVFDAKRVLQLALFAAIMIFAVTWAPLRSATILQLSRLSIFSRYALVLFFFIGIVSSLRLDHPAYALVDVSMMFVMMILIAVTAASRELSGERFDRWAVLLLTAMGFAVVIQEFMGFVAGWVFGSEFSYDQALIHFGHPRFYNQLQTWSIPVLAALPLLFPDRRWVKIGCLVLLALQWFLVIAFAARGTALSLIIAMVFIALWLPAQRRFWVKFQLGGLIAGIAIYSGIIFLNGALIPQSQSGEFVAYSVGRPMAHTSGRTVMWRLSTEDAIKHPVLGTGPAQYACDSDITLPAHPHSFLFQLMGEWGFIAVLLVLMLTTSIGWVFLRDLKHLSKSCNSDPPLKAMLATSLIAGAIHTNLSGLLIMPASQVTVILIGGWVLGLAGNTTKSNQNTFVTNSLLFFCALLACTQFLFSISEIPYLPERTKYSADYGPSVPRFWQDGRACEYNYHFSDAAE